MNCRSFERCELEREEKSKTLHESLELELTVVIIIVDDHWHWFVQSHIVRAISFEHGTDLIRADVVEVHHDDSVTVLGLDFLLESWEDGISFDSHANEIAQTSLTLTFSVAFSSASDSESNVNPLGNETSITAMLEVLVVLSATKLVHTCRSRKSLLELELT